MNDTPKAIQELFHHLLMQRSGEERLKMGYEMFSTSRAIMRSSLADQGLSESEMAVQIFLRTYRSDFSPEVLAKIVERVRTYWENRQSLSQANEDTQDWRLQPEKSTGLETSAGEKTGLEASAGTGLTPKLCAHLPPAKASSPTFFFFSVFLLAMTRKI